MARSSNRDHLLAGCEESTIMLYVFGQASEGLFKADKLQLGPAEFAIVSIAQIPLTNSFLATNRNSLFKFTVLQDALVNPTELIGLRNQTGSGGSIRKIVASLVQSPIVLLIEAEGRAVYFVNTQKESVAFVLDEFRGSYFLGVGKRFVAATAIDLSVHTSYFAVAAKTGSVLIYDPRHNTINSVLGFGLPDPLEVLHAKLTRYYLVVFPGAVKFAELFSRNVQVLSTSNIEGSFSSAQLGFEDSLLLVVDATRLVDFLLDTLCPQACIYCEKFGYQRVCKLCETGYRLTGDHRMCESEKCLASEGPYLQANGSCGSACPSGEAEDFLECQKCADSCLACTAPNEPNACTFCKPPLLLTRDGSCLQVCPAGQFLFPVLNYCFFCPASCIDCDELGKCNTCSPKTKLNTTSGQCLAPCESGYYPEGEGCGKCHQDCETCYGPKPTNCILCTEGLSHSNRQCIEKCPKSQYSNAVERRCFDCPAHCEECLSFDFCTVCANGTHLNSTTRQCQASCEGLPDRYLDRQTNTCFSCPNKCRVCSGGTCLQCADGHDLFLSRCTPVTSIFWMKTAIIFVAVLAVLLLAAMATVGLKLAPQQPSRPLLKNSPDKEKLLFRRHKKSQNDKQIEKAYSKDDMSYSQEDSSMAKL